MYCLHKTRPNTGIVTHNERVIGRVTSQRRQRGQRFWTATLLAPDRTPVACSSLGTRYPTALAATRALAYFDRDYRHVGSSGNRDAINAAVQDHRRRWGVVPGKQFVMPDVIPEPMEV